MPIGTPSQLGVASAGSGLSVAITTLVDSPAGSLIVVLTGGTNGGVSAVSDGTNTYLSTNAVLTANGRVQIWYCAGAAFLASGSTITVAWASSPGDKLACGVTVAGVASSGALDINSTGASGAGTSLSLSTGALAQSIEIIFGATVVDNDPGVWTESSGFTSNTSSNSSHRLRSGYQIVATPTTVTYAPSWVTSRNYVANVVSFKGAQSPSPMLAMFFP